MTRDRSTSDDHEWMNGGIYISSLFYCALRRHCEKVRGRSESKNPIGFANLECMLFSIHGLAKMVFAWRRLFFSLCSASDIDITFVRIQKRHGWQWQN